MCYFVKDKPCAEETHKVNEIGEQVENIRLTRDPSERLLHVQDILSQYRSAII